MHCAAFQCLWLMGFGPDELRPDRIGGYFDAVDSGLLILITDKTKPDPSAALAAFNYGWSANGKADPCI